MPVDIDSPEGHIIRKMVPFSTMPSTVFKVICDKIVIETARSGTFLFKRGDTNNELIYLLKGEVSLEVDKLKMEVIKAGTESARFALAHQLPRKVNGIANGSVQFLRLNSIYITTPDQNQLKKTDAPVNKEVTNTGVNHSWINLLLMVPVLRALVPEQLTKINEQLEEIEYQEGEVITHQGDVGEYYYLIKSGECLQSHKDSDWNQTLTRTKLKIWNSFGAEALIDTSLRSHTVTALTPLSLLRINKQNFMTLIKEPTLKFVDVLEMQVLSECGDLLLDVRSAAKYEESHLEQAINAPLLGLRNYVKELNKDQAIVVVSDNQLLSEAAAFLLLSYKFSVQVLKKDVTQIPLENTSTQENDFNTVKGMDKLQIKIRPSPRKAEPLPELFAAENTALREQMKELQRKAEKAEQEKQEVTQKYQLLLKQSERLKAMLASLTKYNGKI